MGIQNQQQIVVAARKIGGKANGKEQTNGTRRPPSVKRCCGRIVFGMFGKIRAVDRWFLTYWFPQGYLDRR